MEIPPLNDKRWKELVIGNIDFKFEFLAIKILLFRIRLNLKKDNSPEKINYVNPLYFFLFFQVNYLFLDLVEF